MPRIKVKQQVRRPADGDVLQTLAWGGVTRVLGFVVGTLVPQISAVHDLAAHGGTAHRRQMCEQVRDLRRERKHKIKRGPSRRCGLD